MQILLVAKDPDLLRSLSYGLARRGCRVTPASDVEAALAAARFARPDVIVVDADSIDLSPGAGRVLTGPHCTPVLLLSVSDDESCDGRDAGQWRADDILAKPFTVQQLHQRLRATVWRKRRRAPFQAG
ncbi:MAG TPA: response regulator [Dehalococcoidia bacterium]|nr:response regulator [Dehalococcoidia bacterium]